MILARSIPLMALATLLAGCGPSEPDEVRIRKAIESMADAMETGQPEPFLERVAEDFTGDRGAWDRQRVRQYVLGRMLHGRSDPEIDIRHVDVELFNGRARAVVDVGFSGEGRWLPGHGAHYRFETGWRLDDGRWRVINAEWERQDR